MTAYNGNPARAMQEALTTTPNMEALMPDHDQAQKACNGRWTQIDEKVNEILNSIKAATEIPDLFKLTDASSEHETRESEPKDSTQGKSKMSSDPPRYAKQGVLVTNSNYQRWQNHINVEKTNLILRIKFFLIRPLIRHMTIRYTTIRPITQQLNRIIEMMTIEELKQFEKKVEIILLAREYLESEDTLEFNFDN